MANTIQLRRGTASQWTSANTVLASGEVGFETDTNKFKIGIGTASWSELAYAAVDLATASSIYLSISDASNTYLTISASSQFDLIGSASAAELRANSYTSSAIASLVNSAPETLDTLNELAAALGNDANFAASTASAIGNKLDISVAASTYVPINTNFSLTLSGDVSGSVTFNSFNSASVSTIIAPNSVALGTDTTGDYVAGLTAGDGISISGVTGEGWSPTISINSSTASVSFVNITSKPTTLGGYGITDAIPASASSNFLPVSASSNLAPLTILRNEQTGTSYTLVIGDAGKLIEMNNASPNTLIVPLDASASFPVGTKIDVLQTGAGQTTASAVSGVTINSKEGNTKLTGQWSAATLVKRATDTWVLIGDLSA